MLRLTLLLIAGLFAVLFTLGEDKGQLRPGLALADAEGRLDEVWAEARAEAAPVPTPVAVEEPAPLLVAAPQPAPVVADTQVAEMPEVAVEVVPGREVVAVVEEPVFSLESYGNEAVPGEDGARIEGAVDTAAASTAMPEVVPGGEGTIWYVNASSVNVRSAPSTDSDVLGKLGSGEAALLVAAVDNEWARIVIQGDGLEGYVALRYLTPESP